MTTPAIDLDALDPDLVARFRAVRLALFDFDGVFTDNAVYVFEDGREAVMCNRSDGLGIGLLLDAGVEVIVLSKERNPVVTARAKKLGIPAIQSCDDKAAAIDAIMDERNLRPEHVAFIGNDVNDAGALHRAGLPIVVADAHPSVLTAARYVTRAPGGRGAVREVTDLLVAAKTTDES